MRESFFLINPDTGIRVQSENQIKTIDQYKLEKYSPKNPEIMRFVESSTVLSPKVEIDGKEERLKMVPEIVELIAKTTNSILRKLTRQQIEKGNILDFSTADIQEMIGIISVQILSFEKIEYSERGTLEYSQWAKCIEAVRSNKKGLCLNRKPENFDLADFVTYREEQNRNENPESETVSGDKRKIRIRYNHLFECIAIMREKDESRQASHKAKKAYKLLNVAHKNAMEKISGFIEMEPRFLGESANGSDEKSKQARKAAKSFFLEYIATGERLLAMASEREKIEAKKSLHELLVKEKLY